MTYSKKLLQNLLCFLYIYLFSGAVFFLFRLLLLLTSIGQYEALKENRFGVLAEAFFIGWRFDTVISCYILLLPVVTATALLAFKKLKPMVLKIIYIFAGSLFAVAFLISCIDIPFFNQFFMRLNNTVFLWKNDVSFAFQMLIKEKSFYLFFFVFLFFATALFFFMRFMYKRQKKFLPTDADKRSFQYLKWYIPCLILLWGMLFLGIRGRVTIKSPIHIGMAFFCNNIFFNQLGLNPSFTLIKSVEDAHKSSNQRLHVIDDAFALQRCSETFKADSALAHLSPIARTPLISGQMQRKNVVVVIMESMATHNMKRFGNENNLTPFLDKLADENWSFDNVYTAGIHTFNGVYSTLFSHPALGKKHSMRSARAIEMAGFSNILSKNDYQTIFFTTHDEQFDNMSGFLLNNNFQKIVGQKDYPMSELKSNLGVTDHYMFQYAMSILSGLSAKEKPFFATFLTSSNHQPYIIPKNIGFTPRSKDPKMQIVEFSDWSIMQFIASCASQKWFENTIFAFIADHGAAGDEVVYDIVLSYHHSPFIIYAPQQTNSQCFTKLGLQEDIFPTIMGMLNIPYINNTFGINLLTEERPCIVFSSDDRIACMNDSLLYIYRENTAEGIYRYQEKNPNNLQEKYPADMIRMREETFSWLQTSQWMIEQDKAKLPKALENADK